jgi:hypothetical protein
VFHVSIGASYAILGMGTFETTLLALVLDDTGKPNWLPVGLFDVSDAEVPSGWRVAVLNGAAASAAAPAHGWVALWGYPELVRDPEHRDKLIHRDVEALEIFFREAAHESGAER